MSENTNIKREWRDNIFRHLFKEDENFVEMYEVFTGKKLLPKEIEFRNTDSIVMSKDLKNDVAFITKEGSFICLVDHQSSKCPNISLRLLIYYGELLKMYVRKHELNIYGTKPIEYPKAEFFVAYNGKSPWIGDESIVAGDVVINVKVVDINYDQLKVQESSNTLSGYAYLVKQIEYYIKVEKLATGLAADRALKDCRNGGYLLDYVDKEEFLTMVAEVWTIEQQMADRELWAAERARKEVEEEAEKKAEEKAEKKVAKAEKKAEEKAEKKIAKAEEKAAKAEKKIAKAEEKAAKAEKDREADRAKAEKKIAKAEEKAAKAEKDREAERAKAEDEKAGLVERIEYLESLNKSNSKM